MKKEQIVEKVREILKGAKGIYFINYQGIGTSDLNLLRKKMKESNLFFSVVKNRLAAIVFREYGLLDKATPFLKGPTSLIISRTDEIAPARFLKDCQKSYPIKFKGAILEKEVFEANQFDFLASIPPREELFFNFLSSLLSPITQLTSLLEGIQSDLISVMEKITQKDNP
ncbi:MAG: 50S ribosomal protein L10 [candidate division WOR-3 bacterium]